MGRNWKVVAGYRRLTGKRRCAGWAFASGNAQRYERPKSLDVVDEFRRRDSFSTTRTGLVVLAKTVGITSVRPGTIPAQRLDQAIHKAARLMISVWGKILPGHCQL